MTTEQRYARADSIPMQVSLGIAGGVPGYSVCYRVTRDGTAQHAEETAFDAPGTAAFSFMPKSAGTYEIAATVTDAVGTVATASVYLPVAADDSSTRAQWESKLRGVALDSDWRKSIVAVAATQVGYQESAVDFLIDESGKRQGYTIYGDWYGADYTEWCAMFASWCVSKAGIAERDFPYEAGCEKWVRALDGIGAYKRGDYRPEPGDLVFFNLDGRADPDHVGIVERVSEAKLYTIEGNTGHAVARREYALNNSSIMGYASTAALMIRAGALPAPTAEPTAEPTPAAEPEATAEPTPTAELEATVEPAPTAEPEATVEPAPTAEPEATVESAPTADPEATVESAPTAEPEATVESAPTAEPEATVEPIPTAEPEATVEPTPTAELEATTEPTPTVEPEATVEPIPTAEPEATAEPTPTAEPEATTEPTPTAESEATAEPVPTVESTIDPEATSDPAPTVEPEPAADGETDGHVHGEECFDESGSLVCGLSEQQSDALTLVTKIAEIYADAEGLVPLNDGTVITLTGYIPEDASIRAFPIVIEADQTVLCAFDIAIVLPDGTLFEPAPDAPVTVSIQSPTLTAQDMEVYYVPDEGEPEPISATVTDEGVCFDANHFSVYAVMSAGLTLPAGSRLSYTVNETRDAFLKNAAYSAYYNANSPIGTAGSFHIVAFEEAHLYTHTNGNVLAKRLYANANFGTKDYPKELSYVQDYVKVSSGSAWSDDQILALGSGNEVTLQDHGNAFAVNGYKLDRPARLVQDSDTAAATLIDLKRVRTEIGQIAGNLNGFSDANLTYTSASALSADHCRLELTKPGGVGVVHYTASELAQQLGGSVWIDGFKSGASGSVVVNVDCAGASVVSMPQAWVVIDGERQQPTEVREFSAGKVIWNFINAAGVTINTHLMTGIILAPGATVNITQNLNGTVVADNINVHAESHRTDFTGKIVRIDEEYDVVVCKVETGYTGQTLPGAEFDLYRWSGGQWVKVNAQSLVTGGDGTFTLNDLEDGTAYRLVETKSPGGYVLRDGAYGFWVGEALENCPGDFTGSHVDNGGTLYVPNDRRTEDGFQLPETGGAPYRLFAPGMALTAFAAGMLLRKRFRYTGAGKRLP